MKILYFLADRVFRFRYRDPMTNDGNDGGLPTWDLGIYEDEMEKMRLDLFFMGFVIGAILDAIVTGILWVTVR